MPGRKLSQADLDELREASNALDKASNPKSIVLHDGIGNAEEPGWKGPKDITTKTQIAAWKGISESHFYTHRRNGWQLQRGVPYEDRPVESVPADVYASAVKMFKEWIEDRDRRIAELEAELAQLRRNK